MSARPAGFDYLRPSTREEAWAMKSALPEARFVAGGTDLLVQMRRRRVPVPPALISLRGVASLRGIEANGRLRIGAGATLSELIAHPAVRERFPVLAEAARWMGSVQVRNVATVGGNLCNASPAADLAPPLLVLGARVLLEGPRGARELPLERFLLGPGRTARAPDETLAAVLVDPQPPGAACAFLRRGRVRMDLAVASAAVRAVVDGGVLREVRVAAGAVSPAPMRLPEVEALLDGREPAREVLDEARRTASRAVAPITDVRSTAEYRRELAGVLVKRAAERVAGGGRP